MERQTISIDMTPGSGQIKRLNLTKNDTNRPLGVYITESGTPFDCSNLSPSLHIRTPSGDHKTSTVAVDATESNLIIWETSLIETEESGRNMAQIRFSSGSDDIGSSSFVEFVQDVNEQANEPTTP